MRSIAAAVLALALAGAAATAAAAGPYDRYVAPRWACAGATETHVAPRVRARAMLCLINWARRERGLSPLSESGLLDRSARLKTLDILRCREFSHTACGKPFESAFKRAGYTGRRTWAYGENIAWGSGPLGTPREILRGWLHSPGHRKNMFRPSWREQGIYSINVRSFKGYRDVTVWVSQFGQRG